MNAVAILTTCCIGSTQQIRFQSSCLQPDLFNLGHVTTVGLQSLAEYHALIGVEYTRYNSAAKEGGLSHMEHKVSK